MCVDRSVELIPLISQEIFLDRVAQRAGWGVLFYNLGSIGRGTNRTIRYYASLGTNLRNALFWALEHDLFSWSGYSSIHAASLKR